MKKKYNLLRVLGFQAFLLLFLLSNAFGQTNVQIGSGTSTSTNYPIYSCYGYNYSQQIYTGAEITAGGGQTGLITKIRFFVSTNASTPANFNQWTVYLGNTSQDGLASTSAWIPVSSMSQVFSGTINPVAGSWCEIVLTTPFAYTGSNLVVAIDENAPGFSCTASWSSFTSTSLPSSAKRSMLYYSDGTNPNPSSPPTASTSSGTTRAQVQFEISCPNTAPSTISASICSGQAATLTANTVAGTTIKWYDAATGGNLISSGNTLTTPILTTTTSYYPAIALGTCPESPRGIAVATVNDVVLSLNPINESCTGYANGSFSLNTVTCGTAPFTYSTDGGLTFGAIPTNLAAGTHSIIAKDVNNLVSSAISITVGTQSTVVPSSPVVSTPIYNFCSGASTAVISANTPAAPTYTCTSTGTATDYDQNNPTASVTNFSCPTGAVISASLNASALYFGYNYCSYGWYSIDVAVNGTTVATNVCGLTAFDLTPYLPLTSITVTGNDLDGYQDNITVNAAVTFTYTTDLPTLTWYSAANGGNLLGSSTTLETIGTSVVPTAVAGSYNMYVQTELAGCHSVARELVNVNFADVNATINPVHATCNGLANGSFTLGTVSCGTAPFTYSLDTAATFGVIPTNLHAGTYSIIIKDVNNLMSSPIEIIITEPGAPTALAANNVTYYNAVLDWTPSGNETSWLVEYGVTGFALGTGTQVSTTIDSLQLTGVLLANTCYDFYVRATCDTSSVFAGPFNFCTDPGFLSWDNACGPGFMDITTTGTQIQGMTDDSEFGLTLPWSWNINGTQVSTITIGNNGGVIFNTLTGAVYTYASGNGMFPFVQDLDDANAGGGVYYESIGTAPNRMFVIEWSNLPHWSTGTDGATFEIVVMEATGEVYYLYNDVMMSNPSWDLGADAEIVMNTANGNAQISMNNATYLTNNSCVHFYYELCPNITTMTSVVYTDDASIDWNPGLYGESDWTVVYGLAGFDPTASPSQAIDTLNLVSSDVSFGNSLTQLTAYDVYIYSNCTADSLNSNGYLYNFTTLPNCSYPTNITVTTDVDSLGVNWNWVQSPAGSQISDFNIAYVMPGNSVYAGTEAATGSTLFSDTIYDPALMGGGVYQVYVQSVCSNGDTSAYAGPITVTMPLTTDTVCGAEQLNFNTVYTFNNNGATVSLNETNIAPLPTGAQTTDGWINSTLNGTTWYKFTAPATGQVRIDFTSTDYNGQAAVYDVALCSDFNNNFDFVAANDNAIGGTSLAPNFTVCGLTPGNTYHIMHDGFTGTYGNLGIKITEVIVNAGLANATTNICYLDTVNLMSTISSFDLGGSWSSPINSVNANVYDSLFVTEGLAYQTFNLQYKVVDGCANDTVVSQVRIFAPSSAGEDGSINACLHEPIDLLSGLLGVAELSGTWYDPSNVAIANSQITTGGFPGNFNYDYIAGNGVCPDDTANVVVIVSPNCDFLNITEETFAGVEVYPNPTNGVVFIAASMNAGNFSYEVTDANGRVIAEAINGVTAAATTSIDLSKVEIGVYFITLSNATAKKVYRIVVQ